MEEPSMQKEPRMKRQGCDEESPVTAAAVVGGGAREDVCGEDACFLLRPPRAHCHPPV